MSRYYQHPNTTFSTLIEPAQDAVRQALHDTDGSVALVVHDWCMFNFNTHTRKTDRYQRSHETDLGYELGCALIVSAAGQPLGPMELRLRNAAGILSTRVRPTTCPPGHVEELLEVMNESRRWSLNKTLVHVIDREADSVSHYRQWQSRGHLFVVRANQKRLVLHQGTERTLAEVVASLSCNFQDVRTAEREVEVVAIRSGRGVIKVAETEVTLHRSATTRQGDKRVAVPGPPLTLRLVVCRVVDELGVVLAEWWLLTNVAATLADTATIGRWYAWRWRIESYHKLLKSAGQNAEQWEQENGEAFLKRLCVASTACLSVWQLQQEEGEEAKEFRRLLVRLSGRQMKHKVESTAPALLAGLEKLLAYETMLAEFNPQDVLAQARRLLPNLFHHKERSPPVKNL